MSTNRSANRLDSLVRRSFRTNRNDLGSRVIKGVAWQFALSGSRVLITIVSTAILARLLTPNDYGLVAMTTLIVEIAGLFANLGFGAILIQKKRLTRLDLDTAFWASLCIGLTLSIFIAAAAYPASWFFEQPKIVGLLWLSALSFVVQQLLVVPYAIISRLLMFRTEVFLQFGQLLARTVFAIALAWSGAEYWSLVLAPLFAAFVTAVAAMIVTGYRPRLRINFRFIKTNWKASGSYLGSGTLHYLLSNFDFLVVGRRFGPEQLGYYQTAYSLPDELRNRISGPLQRVLFPAYSLLQQDLPAFRSAVARSQKMLSTIVLPMGAGLALIADHLVPVLYGENWLPVVPLLQVLAVGGSLRAMFSLVASIYYATGRPELAFKVNIVSAPFVLTSIAIGSYWGTIGVAWAMVLVLLPSLVSAHIAMGLIGASIIDFLKPVTPSAISTFAMCSALYFMDHNLITEMNTILGITTYVICGALLYSAVLTMTDRKFVTALWITLKKLSDGRQN